MSMIRQILFGAAGRGADLQELLKEVGLTEADLANSGFKLPWQEGIKVWEAVLVVSGDPAFGLHIGQSVTTSMAGLAGHMMERCKNLFESSQILEKYLPLANEMFVFRSGMEGRHLVVNIQPIDIWKIHSPETARQAVDMSFSSILHIIRLLSGRSLKPERVDFSANPPEEMGEYQAVFQTELKFKQSENRMLFKESDALSPVIGYNQEILETLQEIASGKMLAFEREQEVRVAAEKWIAENWQKGFPQVGELAEVLHMSVRSLQRRLKEEGTSFHRIVEEVHEQIALSLLRRKGFTVSEVAFMLGYADAHAFRRAFRRWTGKSPREARKGRA